MSRPLLVGLQNPLSDDPRYALYPEPRGCTGWRIAEMLRPDFSSRDYLRIFDRANLLEPRERVGGPGYAGLLRLAGRDLARRIAESRHERVVLLGVDVVRAVMGAVVDRNSRWPWLKWHHRPLALMSDQAEVVVHVNWLPLPHPSGRNRWYSDAGNLAAAGRALRQLATGADR